MGQALYRKYRSKSLDEIVGQEHITATLKNAIKAGKISHAYLLTGPRGVGKTSIARILAHEVNGLPYQDDSVHLDIIEIDAASNRRIDEIRDLRDKVHISPTSAKYKVYIIDEVHMLTKEAFNALLKTLEEPPEHVIFILATTEAHKLPETIVSRTQRFSFKPIEPQAAVKHLEAIAKSEGIKADTAALELIAEHGDGSFRDSISLLDQAQTAGKKVTVDDVRRILGIPPSEMITQLRDILATGTPKDLLTLLATARQQGFQAATIAKQLGQALRQDVLDNNTSLDAVAALRLLQRLLEVPASPNPDSLLELILLDVVLGRSDTVKYPTVGQKPAVGPARASQTPPAAASTPVATSVKTVKPAAGSSKKPKAPSSKAGFDLDSWADVVDSLKQRYSTLYGVMRMGNPRLEEDRLIIAFRFPFHQKRMSEARNQKIISDIIQERTGQTMVIEAVVDTNLPVPEATASDQTPDAPPVADSSIDTISNIFGTAEVLES